MPLMDHSSYDRIDSLDAVFVSATRLTNWFKTALPTPVVLAAVPREELRSNLLGLALGRTSPSEVEHALTSIAASHARELSETAPERWSTTPFHCGRCAIPYQALMDEVINLTISTNPSDSLAAELATYDHLRLAEFVERNRLDWPYHIGPVLNHIATKGTSPASGILRRLRIEHRAHQQEQLALQRADLVRRVESSVSELAASAPDMSAQQLQSCLEATFLTKQTDINAYIGLHPHIRTGNVFEQLQAAYASATPILPAALRIATSSRDWSLIRTLLLILRRDSHSLPALMAVALLCKKRGAVLELIDKGAQPQPGLPSPPPAAHLMRIREHAEFNEALRRYRIDLDALNPQGRLLRIAQEDQWPLAALPSHYADAAAALSLTEDQLFCLKARLAHAPRGAWRKLRAAIDQMNSGPSMTQSFDCNGQRK